MLEPGPAQQLAMSWRLGRHDDEMTSPVVPVAGAFKTFFRGATQIGLRADVDVWGSRTVSTTLLAS